MDLHVMSRAEDDRIEQLMRDAERRERGPEPGLAEYEVAGPLAGMPREEATEAATLLALWVRSGACHAEGYASALHRRLDLALLRAAEKPGAPVLLTRADWGRVAAELRQMSLVKAGLAYRRRLQASLAALAPASDDIQQETTS